MKSNIKNQPVCEIDLDGTKYWSLNGKRHREDRPAVEFAVDNSKCWYLNGKFYCDSLQPYFYFIKGFLKYLEALKELQNDK